jgi:hypothetical protein
MSQWLLALVFAFVSVSACGSPHPVGRLAGPAAYPASTSAAPTVDPAPRPEPPSVPPATVTPTTTPPKKPSTPPKPTTRPATTAPAPQQWQYAPAGPTFGTAGPLYAYRVAVETGLPVTVDEFAATVNGTLSNPQSWIAGGNVRLAQVGSGSAANFTVWLATPATAKRLCAASGVDITVNGVPYTSCRGGSNVVINGDRYLAAVPDYPGSLSAYRQYAINHEVGHWLGHKHELCPGPGQPAPVMQQQTLGMQGCLANSWPYLDGALYSGPPA